MRYLSDRDARSLMPDADGALAVIDATLSAMAEGAVEMPPRTTLASGGPSRFIAFPARLPRLGVAGVKWFGIDHLPQAARKSASAQILLTAEEGARPLALIDASWITAWRTALMSLHAARLLARPGASRIAFIACGEQARLHLDAFRLYFPLTHLCAWSRTERTADEFAGNARALGLVAEIAGSVPDCVEGADIVIASSPAVTETRFLPGALTPGSFVSLIDLGRSFIYEALAPSDRIHVDDLPQARALIARGDIPSLGGAQLLPLAGGGPPGLTTLPQIFLPTGLGAVDIALGHCIWQAAKDSGIGLILEDENGPA